MSNKEESRFAVALVALGKLYGRQVDRGMVATYWEALHRIGPESVIVSLNRAMTVYPQWFPTAPQLAELAREHARSKAVRKQADDTRKQLPAPKPTQSSRLPDNNPFEQLARRWEAERLPQGVTSDVASQRFREFWALWSEQ
jgi:hypothetical protein